MNCSQQTLKDMHAYERFIDKTLSPLIEELDAHPLHEDINDLEFPEVPSVTCVSLLTATYRASNAWKAHQHTRHMRVVYGK